MARPIKQGLDFFSFDTDFFSDRKVRRIMNACGPNSSSILICLLCNIYKDKGYYIGWDKELPFDIADIVGVSEGAVSEVIKKAIQIEFFDSGLFEKYKILTSNGIQKRFKIGVSKRKEVDINPDYWVYSDNNSVNDVNNSIDDTVNTHSIVYNSIEKETSTNVDEKKKAEELKRLEQEAKAKDQIKKLNAAKAATLKRKDDFYDSLRPYVPRYGKEMIRAFFDYWTEMNKQQTKMRVDKQSTWDLALRLGTWANREPINGKSKIQQEKATTYVVPD